MSVGILRECWNTFIFYCSAQTHSSGSNALNKKGSSSCIHCQLTNSDDMINSSTKTADSLYSGMIWLCQNMWLPPGMVNVKMKIMERMVGLLSKDAAVFSVHYRCLLNEIWLFAAGFCGVVFRGEGKGWGSFTIVLPHIETFFCQTHTSVSYVWPTMLI